MKVYEGIWRYMKVYGGTCRCMGYMEHMRVYEGKWSIRMYMDGYGSIWRYVRYTVVYGGAAPQTTQISDEGAAPIPPAVRRLFHRTRLYPSGQHASNRLSASWEAAVSHTPRSSGRDAGADGRNQRGGCPSFSL